MPRGKAAQAETPEGAAAQAAAPVAPSAPDRKVVLVDTKPKQRTPPEWGMLAMKVKYIVEEERNLESGRVIRHSRMECKELDEAVLMSRNNDYTKFDSNGTEHYFSVPPTVVFVPHRDIESCKRAGFVVVEDAPDWRHFKLKAE